MNNGENNKSNDLAKERLQNATRRGLNTVTGGSWNKVRNTPIIGAAAKKAENKVADKLGNSKLGQKIANHQRPNLGVKPQNENNPESVDKPITPKSNDIGSQNLRNSLANKAKNLVNLRKKRKKNNDDNSNQSENNSSSDENKDESENDSLLSTNEKIRIKRRLQIKLAIVGLLLFSIYFFIMLIVAIVTGGSVFKTAPITAINDYGTDSFASITSEDSVAHKDEVAFYEAIKNKKKDLDEKVDINYVVAILIDVFYEYDATQDYEGEDSKQIDEAGGIDYAKMTKNIDTFVDFIENLDSTDYEIHGEIYEALKNSDEFKTYYRGALKNNEEAIEEILDNIFYLASELNAEDNYDDTTITSETNIKNTTDNKKTTSMSINDYMTDSIYASTNKIDNKELVKAYTVIYSTNIVSANKKLTINSNNASTSNQLCSVKNGCSYDANGNLVSGSGSQNEKNTEYYNGNYYYKVPLTDAEQKELKSSINSTFGNVLTNSDGTYPNVDVSKLDGFGDGDYKTIIKNAYGDNYKYKNVGENSYVLDGSYGDKKVKTDVIFYDQKSYPNTFCGLKGYTIGGSGCGVTAMAIVASTYENNKKYDPIYMNNEARKKGMCGKTGTAQAFFGKEANTLHYKYLTGTKYNKSILNSTLKHLSQGHLVVVRMGSGHFTGGGHYMVLGGVDPDTKKVYVYDPNNKSNSSYRKTGNGWYSFNDIIVKEAYNFYIIWKG